MAKGRTPSNLPPVCQGAASAGSACPQTVLDLVKRFREHKHEYTGGTYNEAQVRREFIDPFFATLGWDVDNRAGLAEAYKDVIHEDAIKIGGEAKAPDYCFRIGGTRKFFVEAKKPAVDVAGDPSPAYQLRRYAWSSKLPLSVVTDFEEFAVYDCRIKPNLRDKASAARVFICTSDEYAGRWEWIASVFSKEAILKGAFDRFAESTARKRGTALVDDAFLAEIEGWRDALAHNLALRNPGLAERELNFAVGRIIDRIVFLRMCEDRGIETYAALRGLLNGEAAYARLMELCRRADERYNSGLFHFEPERDRPEPPDDLTPGLAVDDKALKDILRSLYYPESPYEFSVLPADILGHVYEQFLGKVIRLTPGHRAKVEEKPEVRKAGGVYYTPTYIVDYIVKHTVGELLAQADTPEKAAKLRILDPACGSGSFLLGAYQYLLDWHRDWYAAHEPDKWTTGRRPRIHQTARGDWRLTTAERKRILLNNIYGVDIDPQAVEVTKLSLLLKVLEGETSETLDRQFRLFHERALPDLAGNIKCGNSLIGSDFYNGHQLSLFDEEERFRINVFDWDGNDGFPEIIKSGGFDAVIGNPPYGATFHSDTVSYLRGCYPACSSNLDSYVLFMQQATYLARANGLASFIVPTGWYTGADFSRIRQHIAQTCDPVAFVNLPYDVFKAWIDTTVFVLRKRQTLAGWPRKEQCTASLKVFPKRHKIEDAGEMEDGPDFVDFAVWFTSGDDAYLTFADAKATAVIHKMDAVGRPLAEFADVQRGVTPFATTGKPTHATSRPAFKGTVRRYVFEPGPRAYVRFDKTLAEPKPLKYFKGPRLLLRELISRQFRLQAVKVTKDLVTNKSLQSVLVVGGGPDLNYILGLLNSRLLSWYFLRKSSVAQRDDFPKIVLKESRSLPMPPPNLDDAMGRKNHDRMVRLVDQMLSLHNSLAAARTPDAKTALQRQIDATDRRIDRLVYDLYGLTEEEIKIVEEATHV